MLSWVIGRGALDQGWVQAFERWYPAEADLGGYDERLGWLHAVAHGADLIGVLGADQRVRPERLLAPYASNTMRTLQMLYVLADRGVRAGPDDAVRPLTHRDEVLARLAKSLATVAWSG